MARHFSTPMVAAVASVAMLAGSVPAAAAGQAAPKRSASMPVPASERVEDASEARSIPKGLLIAAALAIGGGIAIALSNNKKKSVSPGGK